MPTYSQANRPLSVTTPLGADKLLLIGLTGREAISELYCYQLELLAENGTDVQFDKLLGQKVTAKIGREGKEVRCFSGIVSRIAQGARDQTFTQYRFEVVPQFWLLTRGRQSRIFQSKTVPEILKKVLTGLDVTYEIQGDFHPRNYCVQYQESDFAFASRLMEEEGIYYFFKHTASNHTMVLADTPHSHPDCEPSKTIYEEIGGGNRPEDRVYAWLKNQELRSGKYTLWDHTFGLPGKHLDATKTTQETVQAGTVSHKLKTAGNDKLELYDYPGGYAGRIDGGTPANVFSDNKRTVDIRMQAEAAETLDIEGESSCGQFTAGYRFALERHFNANGQYVLTSVEHEARLTGDYRSDNAQHGFEYQNSFHSIPFALPFRPARLTPLPRVYGTQSAVVAGPSGEEIPTDKYGRIKVQFPWDREGQNDGASSCWLRVATPWAGKQWGIIHIPRMGQEVIVDFIDGDINQPIVVGSVYNAEQMPPYALPGNKTQSGIRSRSSLDGSPANCNEIRFEDKMGSEQILVHAEKNRDIEVEHDETHWVGHDQTIKIDNNQTLTVKQNRTTELTQGNDSLTIKMGNASTEISMGNSSMRIKMGNSATKLDLGKSETEAMQSIELKVGQSSIKLDQMGVTIKGMMISIEGQIQTDVKGLMTNVNASAMLTCKGAITMIN